MDDDIETGGLHGYVSYSLNSLEGIIKRTLYRKAVGLSKGALNPNS